jgi:hypothetical protein
MNDMSSSTELGPTPVRQTEDDLVACWRLEQFGSLGFNLADALLLTDSDADLHRARKLVADGCPLGTAMRILL